MTEEERKQWWRVVAIVVVGGGLVIGGWVEFMRPATAEPIPKLTASVSDQTYPDSNPNGWSRSLHQVNNPPAVPSPGDVVLTAGTLPQIPSIPGGSGPMVPTVSPSMPVLVPPLADPGIPGPHGFDSGLIGGGTQPLALPPIPGPGAMPSMLPAPATPTIPSMPPQPIGSPVGYGIPPAPPVPALPTVPALTPAMNNPATPGVPPGGSGTAPSFDLTPATPPIQFPDSIQPVMPVRPDSSLQDGNRGITVKTENFPVVGGVGSLPPLPGMLPAIPVQGVGQTPIPQPGGNSGLPALPAVGIPGIPPSGTVVDRPKPAEGLVPYSEKDAFSSPVLIPHDSNAPGDNTMLKHHQQAAALAILGGMFLVPATPTHAANSFLPLPATTPVVDMKDDKVELSTLKVQIDTANQKLSDIQEQLKKLTELLNGRKDERGYPVPSDPGVLAQIKSLKDKLEAIDRDLTTFKNQTSSSLRPQTPINPIVDPKAGKGMVRVVNEYPIQISMVVNGTSFKIAPNQALDIDVPAGEFNYQLLQSGAAPTKSYIKEKETVTLRIK